MKDRIPFHPASEFEGEAASYRNQCTSRKRCKTCRAEKVAEEMEQGRARMNLIHKSEVRV